MFIRHARKIAWMLMAVLLVMPPEKDLAGDQKENQPGGADALKSVKELGNSSNRDGNIIYEVSSAKPLVDDIKFTVEDIGGMAVAKCIPNCSRPDLRTDNAGLYWKLGEIQSGPYWVGLLYQSNFDLRWPEREAPAPKSRIYLNGRVIQCFTTSNPIMVAPGIWFAELQSASAEVLKAGDEIAVCSGVWPGGIGRLALYRKEPVRGAFRASTNFEGHFCYGNYTALGVNACALFVNTTGQPYSFITNETPRQVADSTQDLLMDKDGNAVAYCYLANPLPVPISVDYECLVRGHYLEIAGRDSGRLTLAPHSRSIREVKFVLTPDNPSYSIDAKISAVNPPDLGWPEAETVSFFPGLRQSIPWPDPFSFRSAIRLDLEKSMNDTHQRISLDGRKWEVALTTDLNPPMPFSDKLEFKPQPVPVHLLLSKIVPRPHGAYFRRSFELPPDATQRAYKLCISSVVDEATAYVNGQKVGNVRGNCAMLLTDITDAVKPGSNELVIVVGDIVAIMNPAYVTPESPTNSSSRYLDAPGVDGEWLIGLDHVWLESTPAVSAGEIMVFPSQRKDSLKVSTTLSNHSKENAHVFVKAVVQDERQEVFEIGSRELTIEPGKPVNLDFIEPFPESRWWCPWKWSPEIWSPQSPKLYVMAVEVTDASTGKRLDLARQRFGFRESWIDGPDIRFNGKKVKLNGMTCVATVSLRSDFQLYRDPPDHLTSIDFLDEFGAMCSKSLGGVFNSPSIHNVERDAFWESATKNMLNTAPRFINHPSIMAWDLSNEWFWVLDQVRGDLSLGAKRLKAMSDKMNEMDPTRWTFFNGDGDLNGLMDNFAGHYMFNYNNYNNSEILKHTPYFPDRAFWAPIERGFAPEENVSYQSSALKTILRPDKKVVMDTEELWKTLTLMPPWHDTGRRRGRCYFSCD